MGKGNSCLTIFSSVLLLMGIAVSPSFAANAGDLAFNYDLDEGYPFETSTHPMRYSDIQKRKEVKAKREAAPAKMTKSEPAPRAMSSESGMLSAGIAIPTGKRDSSSLWIEKFYPARVKVGQAYKYIIKATNLTDAYLQKVSVNEVLPKDFKVSSTDPAISRTSGDQSIWDLGVLKPRETKTIVIEGVVGSKAELPCCTTGSFDNASLCVETSVVEPALKVDANILPEEVSACDEIPVTCTVQNSGDMTLSSVNVKGELPAGLTTIEGRNAFSMAAGTLAAGASKQVTIKAKAQKPGTYSVSCSATGDEGTSAKSNTDSVKVMQPVLDIQAICGSKAYVGRDLKCDLNVSNKGDAAAKSVVVEASLPSNASFVSASDGGQYSAGKVRWTMASLEKGGNKGLSIKYKAIGAGDVPIKAMVKAGCSEAASANCSSEVSGIAAILLEVVDVADPIEVGETETYVITVTNQGSAPDNNVKIVVTLEDDMEYVSSSGVTTGSISGNTVTFAPLASLAPKATATWKVMLKGKKEGDVRFKTTMTSDMLSRPVEETESTHVY